MESFLLFSKRAPLCYPQDVSLPNCSRINSSLLYSSLNYRRYIFITILTEIVVAATYNIRDIKITFTPNGKRKFVPRDQVFPLFFVYWGLLLLLKMSSFMPVLSKRIVLDCFYVLIFYSEKFSTDFAVCRMP